MSNTIDQSETLRIVDGVIETHSGKRVIGRFPEVERLSMYDIESLTFPLSVFPSYEVALIRVFFFGDEWKISTTKKLDAFDSYWGSLHSFGWQFELLVWNLTAMPEVGLEVFLNSLDTSKGYFFLIPLEGAQRTGNMRSHTRDVLWLAGIEENGQIKIDFEEPSNIWSLLPRVVFESPRQLQEHIEKGYREEVPPLTGFMLCTPEKHIRIVHPEYLRLYNLRKNEPNIYKRYLEIENHQDCQEFFRQHRRSLQPFVKDLEGFITYLHEKYLERYVHKQVQILPPKSHAVLKACHSEYVKDRKKFITRNRLKSILMNNFPTKFILSAMAAEGRSQYEQYH